MNITQEGKEQSELRDQSDLGIVKNKLDTEAYNQKHRKIKIIIAYQPRVTMMWAIGTLYQYPSMVISQRIFSYPHNIGTTFYTDKVDKLIVLQESKLKS